MFQVKVCSKCGIEKSIDDFYKDKNCKFGLRPDCKSCTKNRNNELRVNKIKSDSNYKLFETLRNKRLYEAHRNDEAYMKNIRKSSLIYYYKNINKCREDGRNNYKKNKVKLNEYSKNYYSKNKEKALAYFKNYYNNNKSKYVKYSRDRYTKSLENRAEKWMRNFLYRTEQSGFKRKELNTVTEFGYSPIQLIMRIECQFKPGMSWDNRNLWHIDHKKPISSFINKSPRTINMLCNLQPLWKTENLSKGNKF